MAIMATPGATTPPSLRPQGCKSALTSAVLQPHLFCKALNPQLLARRQLFKPHLSGQAFAPPKLCQEASGQPRERYQDPEEIPGFQSRLGSQSTELAREERQYETDLNVKVVHGNSLSDAQRTASPNEAKKVCYFNLKQ